MKHTNNIFKSFVHAFEGFKCACSERNVRIHILASICVCLLSYLLKISAMEWAFISSAIALAFIAEFINTCIELLCDLITTDYSHAIKTIKDIAAASVVISALYALSIALLILSPKIILYI